MGLKFVGDEPQSTERVDTGLYLLDKNLGDVQGNRGFPLRSLVEVYGPKGVGKTTFATDIAGFIAKSTGNNIDYCDIEGQSRETLESILNNAGFDGKVNMVAMRSKETPEDTLQRFLDATFAKGAGIGVFDAIGAFTSGNEFKGKLTDRHTGEKPFVMGRFAGRLLRAVVTDEESARVIFMLNHEHPTFGGLAHGQDTGGGVKKKYLSHVRIRLQAGFIGKGYVGFEQGFLIKGKIDNNRYGYDKGIFYAFVLKGQGIHRGLTAMWECIALKDAQVSSSEKIGEGTTVKIDGKGVGKIGDIMRGRDQFDFTPFYNLLRQHDTESLIADSEEEPDESEE